MVQIDAQTYVHGLRRRRAVTLVIVVEGNADYINRIKAAIVRAKIHTAQIIVKLGHLACGCGNKPDAVIHDSQQGGPFCVKGQGVPEVNRMLAALYGIGCKRD